jgi:PAS domain S-box-containing protein
VVDDRPENVLAMRAILSEPAYEVITCSSGREALAQAVARDDLAVILLDVHMPGLDGLTTARLIRERSRAVPIIFLTADNMDMRAVDEAYSIGAVDYLIKPLDPKMVRSKVAVFVELYRKTDELRRKEELLLELERAQYEATFEQAPIGIAQLSFGGRLRRVNRCFCQTLGGSPEEMLALGLADLVFPDDLPALAKALDEMGGGGLARFAVETRWRQRSGRAVWVSAALSLLRDADGRPRHVILLLEDIEERKRAEEGQHLLAEVSELLMGTLDAPERLAGLAPLCVPMLADLCVLQLEDAETAAALAPPGRELAQAALGRCFTAAALAARPPHGLVELAGPPARGPLAVLWGLGVRTVLAVPLTARGRVLGALTFGLEAGRRFRDGDIALAEQVAHRTALALDNALLYAQAQDAVRVREEFLSIASHELRTPLTPLQIQLQRLIGSRSKAALENIAPEKLRAILVRAERQVQRLAALIDNLLDVSRITAGKLKLEIEPNVDLVELARDAAVRFNEELVRVGSLLAICADGPVLGSWDRLRLEQVVTNLVSNAVKYGPGKPIDVAISADGERAVLSVTDRGIGIAADKLDKVFDRFERAVSARSYGGLGLGLYIARQIVDAHGGEIRVDSRVGEGSTFTVSLPRGA